MDEPVRVNGETTEDFPSPQDSLQEDKDVSCKQTEQSDPPEETVESPKTAEQPEPLQKEQSAPSSGSAISSLIAGRNCIIRTTIVTELTKTHVEPLNSEVQNNGQVIKLLFYISKALLCFFEHLVGWIHKQSFITILLLLIVSGFTAFY